MGPLGIQEPQQLCCCGPYPPFRNRNSPPYYPRNVEIDGSLVAQRVPVKERDRISQEPLDCEKDYGEVAAKPRKLESLIATRPQAK
jgi:hypothetical protein